jgi:ADP-heptose:LPS heptosyltransferase
MKDIAFRCRHFRNDRPCAFHKEQGVHCSSCPHKDLIEHRILLIKLDSPGDVLRTTCLLPSLKQAYSSSQITWLTLESSRTLLENNPNISRIVDRWEEMFAILRTEHFDIAINPDANPQAARLLEMASADEKLGMGWAEAGHVRACNEEAEKWLLMGLFDDVKRANRDTYQAIIHQLCRLELVDPRPAFHLTEDERHFAEEYFQSLDLDRQRPIIGMNTGAGARWSKKSWKVEHQVELVRSVKENHPGWQILLLGGPEEVERNQILEEHCANQVINTGFHTVRKFAALVGQTHVLITADTLALHIGLALGRQIVALFGPTSHEEIDLCTSGVKLFPELDCLGCYLNDCNKSPDCMDLITPEMVLAAVERRLGRID